MSLPQVVWSVNPEGLIQGLETSTARKKRAEVWGAGGGEFEQGVARHRVGANERPMAEVGTGCDEVEPAGEALEGATHGSGSWIDSDERHGQLLCKVGAEHPFKVREARRRAESARRIRAKTNSN